MKSRLVYKFIGKVLVGFSILFILPTIVALIKHENIIPFFIPQVISLLLGLLLSRIDTRNSSYYAKDGFYIVTFSWIIISLIGSLPFIINGDCGVVDAIFETVSGFTTTGATIFTDVENINKSILFWRSFSHFIGGMGVLAFVMTVIPLASKDKSMHLLKAEMPGVKVEKMVPKVKETLMYLYGIYIGLTLTEVILLFISGLNLFDSILLSFGTAGTGGFSVLNSSLASYSDFSKIIVAIFMFLFGVNFNIYFLILMRDIKDIFKSEELRVYITLYVIAVLFVILNTINIIGNIKETIIEAIFHVSSFMTSTGYSIGNVDIYPTSCKVMILFLMLISACSGSTCGGFKISRLIISFKDILRSLRRIVYPNRVENITFEGKKVSEDIVKSTNIFLLLYAVIIITMMFIIGLDGHSLETTLNAVFTTFANVGLCFGIDNFSTFSNVSKIVMSIGMLMGRLEVFPIITIISDFTRN
ncbi:MAG: TrkH family potassium uptake protein [Bacilli bacterium]|nr:TrkH family potassium uptake protein [Bacilli bacterium]